MNRQSEHDAVGSALAAYEHALDVYDRMVYGGTATDREIEHAQDDVDNLAELVAATRQAKGTATGRLVVSPPELPAETAWLRDVQLEW